RAFNPPSGYIVTANNDIRPPGYSVPLNFEFATPYRANRVAEVLRSGFKFSVRDFEQLQHDELSTQARTLVPLLLAAATRFDRASQWEYRTLKGWDYEMRADQQAPLLFESWKRALGSITLRRIAGGDSAVAALGDSWIDE